MIELRYIHLGRFGEVNELRGRAKAKDFRRGDEGGGRSPPSSHIGVRLQNPPSHPKRCE